MGNGMASENFQITTIEQLEQLYGPARHVAVLKEVEEITPSYARLIEAAPFVAIATGGPEGLDCSPKGDPAGFVRILNNKTLAIPDRPGNNRIDGMRNIVRDPRVALLFLIPGVGETLRVNGRATISVDPDLLQSFAIGGKLPRSIMLITIERIYFHCAKAIMRSKLWSESSKIDRASLPSTGTIVAELSSGKFGGETYDREAPARLQAELY
jgi:PPOX class probable FMN-dependent enzyme